MEGGGDPQPWSPGTALDRSVGFSSSPHTEWMTVPAQIRGLWVTSVLTHGLVVILSLKTVHLAEDSGPDSFPELWMEVS